MEDDDEGERPRRKAILRINYNQIHDSFFTEKFRLTKTDTEFVLEHIAGQIRHRTERNDALTPEQQLLTALHWFSTGNQYHANGDMHGCSKSTVCRVVHRVANAIVDYLIILFRGRRIVQIWSGNF